MGSEDSKEVFLLTQYREYAGKMCWIYFNSHWFDDGVVTDISLQGDELVVTFDNGNASILVPPDSFGRYEHFALRWGRDESQTDSKYGDKIFVKGMAFPDIDIEEWVECSIRATPDESPTDMWEVVRCSDHFITVALDEEIH